MFIKIRNKSAAMLAFGIFLFSVAYASGTVAPPAESSIDVDDLVKKTEKMAEDMQNWNNMMREGKIKKDIDNFINAVQPIVSGYQETGIINIDDLKEIMRSLRSLHEADRLVSNEKLVSLAVSLQIAILSDLEKVDKEGSNSKYTDEEYKFLTESQEWLRKIISG